MLGINIVLAALAVGSVSATNAFWQMQTSPLLKRQNQYIPGKTQCTGGGTTCEEACGPGTVFCGDPSDLLCYNPGIGQPCCGATSDSPWACDAGDFCLVDGYCCPGGVSPAQCALSLGVTLPATYSASTATVGASAAAVTTGNAAAGTSSATPALTYSGSPAQNTSSPTIAPFTGGASVHNVVGSTSVFSAMMALLLNLF